MSINEHFDKKIIGQAKNIKIKNGVLSFTVHKNKSYLEKPFKEFKSLIKDPIIISFLKGIIFGYTVIFIYYLLLKII